MIDDEVPLNGDVVRVPSAPNAPSESNASIATTPVKDTRPLLERLGPLPANCRDVTSEKSGTIFGIVGAPFRTGK